MIDKQAIFNAVVAHSRAQPRKAMKNSTCRYRTETGDKCFVGALIPDELYDECLEGGSIMSLMSYRTELDQMSSSNRKVYELLTKMYGTLDEKEWELLKQLQRTHDEFRVEDWEREHRRVATYFDLKYTPQE